MPDSLLLEGKDEEEKEKIILDQVQVIQYITNPTPNVQAYVVNLNRKMIRYIKHPTDEVAMLAKLLE